MHAIPRTLTITALAAILALPTIARADWERAADPRATQAAQILASQNSDQQKLAELRRLLADWPQALLFWADQVQKGQAIQVGRELFHAADATRSAKLAIGHELVGRWHDAEFQTEFAHYLVQAALEGGQHEFMTTRDQLAHTAVGEIAYIAAGFEGMPPSMFPSLADPKLIPILINCLDAPDHVYPKDQGDVIRGKPGESTGRNVPRQLLPIALARLNAADSIPTLQQILSSHQTTGISAPIPPTPSAASATSPPSTM